MTPSSRTTQALDKFVRRLLDNQQQTVGRLPRLPYDSKWPSPCYQASPAEGTAVSWQPVRRQQTTDLFNRIATALEQPLHPDIICYYSRYWSDPLPADSSEGRLSLLQLWNAEDGERLRGNLIGHALNKARQKQPLTLFFACTESDDQFVSIDNASGTVWLETPGKKPLRQIATSLADFLDSLDPAPIPDQE